MLIFLKFPKAYIGDLVRKFVPSICECVQRRKPSREEASVCSKVSLISHFIVEPRKMPFLNPVRSFELSRLPRAESRTKIAS